MAFSATARPVSVVALSMCLAAMCAPCAADLDSKAIGLDALRARLGDDTPDGTGVIAGHTEAPTGQGDWAPDPNHAQLQGKSWVYSPANPTSWSGHATTVARHYYGNVISPAPGITTIFAWEVNNWLNFALRMNQTNTPPAQTDAEILNNSWIGTFGNNSLNNQALRRVDYLVNDQGIVVTGGVNNNAGWSTQNTLLSHMYNGISVGRSDGNHNAGTTFNGIDGAGRMKPEIVAPDTATSWTTGIVSGCVAILRETARDTPGPNPNADRPEVIKATLLGGATHRAGWTNFPEVSGPNRGVTAAPLDPLYGVDQVNINTSHLILTAGERDGTFGMPGSTDLAGYGWDLATIQSSQSVYYRFEIGETADEAVFLCTWNRRVPVNFGSFEIPNIDLELFSINAQGQLVSLRGANAGVFQAGNIASVSQVDNVEHLFIQGLAPGTYALEVKRTADAFGAWDVATTWVTPARESAPADLLAFTIVKGSLLDGTLGDLLDSDNSYVHTVSGFGTSFVDAHHMEMLIEGNTSVTSPAFLDILIEQRIDEPSGIAQVRLRNWTSGVLEQVGTYAIGSSDATRTTSGVSAANYVDGSGDIDLSIRHIVFVPFFAFTFESFIDHVEISVR